MPIPVAVAELIGTFLETLGYGTYIVIFPRCLGILRKRQIGRGLMSYLLITMVITFILITMHLIVDLTRAFTAFTGNMDYPGSPEKYYANVDTALVMTKNASYITATLLSDALLVYRTFIVWGRKHWVVVLPALLLLLDAAMSVWFTWSLNQAKPGKSVLISTAFARSKYFYAATLAVNLLCTFLIAFRIWHIHRTSNCCSELKHKNNVLSAILESAAIYTAILLCLIGTSVSDNSAMFIFLNSLPPVIGSVFSYVIIRSSMDNKRFDTWTTRSGVGHNPGSSISRLRNDYQNDDMHDLSGGVVVHIQNTVQRDVEPGSEHYSSYKDN